MNHRHAESLVEESVEESQTPVAVAGLVMIVAIGALLLNVFDLDVPGRALLAVVSLLTVPGIPIAMALPMSEVHVQFVLGIALSLTAVLLVTTLQLTTGAWSPLATQVILLVMGLGATALVGRSAWNGSSVTAR